MRTFMILSAVVALAIPGQVWAGSTGPRQILGIGCHNVDNTCYIDISGDPVGPVACQSTSIRWNERNDPNGKAILSLLTAAYLAGKSVSIYINDSACYANQPTYPTIIYINLL